MTQATLHIQAYDVAGLGGIDLTFAPGVTALVGPNGAGKSTLLRVVTGVLAAHATVRCGDQDWTGLPAWRRSVGWVPQERDLFPHLTLRDNIAFGPRSRGIRRTTAGALADDWLDRLGIAALAARRPDQVSGGEAQRAAIARALAIDPAVLAMDEPFASLDVGVAEQLRRDLAPHLAGRITLLVTHDPIDLRELAEAVVVLDQGQVRQSGSLSEVGHSPGTAHAARLTGANVRRGSSHGTTVTLDDGIEITTSTAHDGPVVVTFSATAVTVSRREPHGSARNVWPCVVRRLSVDGHTARVELDPPGITADLTSAAADELGLDVGTPVFASLKATEVRVLPTPR